VSRAIIILRSTHCHFAIKSGGHAAFTGGSNIQDGVTIDLVNLNQIQVSKDLKTTSIGPGNRWVDVYSKLQAMNLTVIGGRVSDIGVGGLTLGGMFNAKLIELLGILTTLIGGISFFSGRFGWACDNVNNYEV
jgi:FAD binding domain